MPAFRMSGVRGLESVCWTLLHPHGCQKRGIPWGKSLSWGHISVLSRGLTRPLVRSNASSVYTLIGKSDHRWKLLTVNDWNAVQFFMGQRWEILTWFSKSCHGSRKDKLNDDTRYNASEIKESQSTLNRTTMSHT